MQGTAHMLTPANNRLGKILGFIACLLASPRLLAQNAQNGDSGNAPYQAVREWVDGLNVPPVKSLPFKARVEIETTKTLADGTTVTRKTVNIIARDKDGRTHNEGRELISAAASKEPKLFYITLYDPETRVRTTLYPSNHLARTYQFPPPIPATPKASGRGAPSEPAVKIEDLGNDVIFGFTVRIRRATKTYPPEMLGNDLPLVAVDEYWYAADIRLNLLVTHEDPRYGKQQLRVTEITVGDPDESLFQVPPDYKVVDESASTPKNP
jgi:hypothetical protein